MNTDDRDAIILITSSDPECSRFGTGFVIHQNDKITYLLTCAHVVRDVGGQNKVKANGHQANLEALGDTHGCDLAVLAVETALTTKIPLKLGLVGEKGIEFIASGFYTDDTKTHKLASVSGKLGETQLIANEGDRTLAWDLEISHDSKYDLQPGYSGSPVIDKISGYVLGVITQSIPERKGLAISIDALEKIWKGNSDNLFLTKPYSLINKPNQERGYSQVRQVKMNLQDIIRYGIINELAALFNNKEIADLLLDTIDFPGHIRPIFPQSGTTLGYWQGICKQIQNGALPSGNDLQPLVDEAAGIYPANPIFQRYRS